MSKKLGIGVNASEIKAYTVKLDCEYIWYDKRIKKEAIFEVMASNRELATSKSFRT